MGKMFCPFIAQGVAGQSRVVRAAIKNLGLGFTAHLIQHDLLDRFKCLGHSEKINQLLHSFATDFTAKDPSIYI